MITREKAVQEMLSFEKAVERVEQEIITNAREGNDYCFLDKNIEKKFYEKIVRMLKNNNFKVKRSLLGSTIISWEDHE